MHDLNDLYSDYGNDEENWVESQRQDEEDMRFDEEEAMRVIAAQG